MCEKSISQYLISTINVFFYTISLLSSIRITRFLFNATSVCYFYHKFLQFKNIQKNIRDQMEIKFNYYPKWQTVEPIPTKKTIISMDDVQTFQKTSIYAQYTSYLIDLQASIRSKKISQTVRIEKFKIFQQYFQQLEKLLDQTPPIKQPMRFGNRAFKDWLKKTQQYTSQFLDRLLPQKLSKFKEELYRYIVQSFGSNVRIDYGTGHELSFMFFCWSLRRLGYYQKEQYQQMVRQLFYSYINTMRKIQVLYNLEPAGSHGVWGLDDYHFLPFLLGSSQLIDNQVMPEPDSIRNDNLVNKYYRDYMYINCVKFIKEQKKGIPFEESSPILDNISGAASWNKVTNGMIKMYQVQVLGKHPVIKHAFFGAIIKYQ